MYVYESAAEAKSPRRVPMVPENDSALGNSFVSLLILTSLA